MTLRFTVPGIPAPQGSKRAFVVNGRAVLTEASARVKPWRDSVTAAARDAMTGPMLDGPVAVQIEFWFVRPKSSKRVCPSVRPDVDKLARAVLDGLTAAGVYRDDSQVVELAAAKSYTTTPGCSVIVTPLE